MSDTFLFRFRDVTDDDPIGSHRRIINDTSYVWWGWWKKDWERQPEQELQALQENARSTGITIGLFELTRPSFFVAKVTDCIYTREPIHSPEQDRTPRYYSQKKVAAWLKLTSVDEVDEGKFCQMFGNVPTGEETFFFALNNGDALRAESPSTPDAIPLLSSTVLHLSDIHLGSDYGFAKTTGPGAASLSNLILSDLGDEPPGLVVISGDFTTRAEANVLFNNGLGFIRDLGDRLNVPRERFILVPGNHDISLVDWQAHSYSHEESFRLFTKEFFGEVREYPDLRAFRFPDGRILEVLSINSVRLRSQKEKQFGFVEWELYERLLRKHRHEKDVLRIAVLHHHLVAAPRQERLDEEHPEASISTTLDSGAVIEGLQRHGFTMALHGHQHVPAITRIARATRPNGHGSDVCDLADTLVVLAAGSAGAKQERLSDEMRDNSYNIVRFLPSHTEVEARRYNPGSPPERLFRFRASY